jgi:hypothetical protein
MQQMPFEPVSNAQCKQYSPGVEATPGEFEPGDFILTHGASFFSKLIRFGQRLRFYGPDAKYCWWNHAAFIISPTGDLIEALGAGVQQTNISKYKSTDYTLVKLGPIATPHDRNQAVKFAKQCLRLKYDVLTIISISFSLLTGAKFNFGYDGQSICSGLVARALERTDAVFNRTPSHITPADLAKYFNIDPPPKGTPKGNPPKE